jgi:hypothetical protein
MFCTRCGARNADDARFCRNCANPLARTASQTSRPEGRPETGQHADLPYPGYQGNQNPIFQGQQPPLPMQAPPSYGQVYPPAQGASGRAIASLVLTLLGLVTGCGPFLSIPALILGKLELDAIHRGQAPKAGETLAKLGFYGGIAVTTLYCMGGLLYGLLAGLLSVTIN